MTAVRALVRSVLAEPRAPGAPRRVWRDWVLVVGGGLGIVTEALLRTDVMWRWVTMLIGLAVVVTLPSRRTHPLPVAAACFGGMLVLSTGQLFTGAANGGYYSMAVLVVSLHSLVRWGSGREILAGGAIVLATSTVAVFADYENLSEAIGGYTVIAVIAAVGLAVRFRAAVRRRELEQVRATEREHLARDLHDTVAHHVSAIAIRAQAGLAVAPTRPEAAVEALRVIEAEASRTLGEMRAMVGVLRRDEPATLAPTPTLDDLQRLASAPGDGGPSVEVAIADGLADVAPAVATAVCRIAQESVTNARRHGRRVSLIAVTVTAEPDRVHLRVADDGDPVVLAGAAGYGIVGMVERAELLGGACTAGPGAGRGWVVTASIPRDGQRP